VTEAAVGSFSQPHGELASRIFSANPTWNLLKPGGEGAKGKAKARRGRSHGPHLHVKYPGHFTWCTWSRTSGLLSERLKYLFSHQEVELMDPAEPPHSALAFEFECGVAVLLIAVARSHERRTDRESAAHAPLELGACVWLAQAEKTSAPRVRTKRKQYTTGLYF
jgi:hypothetical protein